MNFPDDENGALLREMAAAGIDLSQTHAVDFFHLFEKQPQAQQMADLVNQKHPSVTVKVFADEQTKGVWDVCCTVNIIPTHADIATHEKMFENIAEQCNGYADGWGLMG